MEPLEEAWCGVAQRGPKPGHRHTIWACLLEHQLCGGGRVGGRGERGGTVTERKKKEDRSCNKLGVCYSVNTGIKSQREEQKEKREGEGENHRLLETKRGW